MTGKRRCEQREKEGKKERKTIRRKEEADAKVVRNDEPLGVLFLRLLLLRAILCLSVSSSLVSFPPTAEVRSFVGSFFFFVCRLFWICHDRPQARGKYS